MIAARKKTTTIRPNQDAANTKRRYFESIGKVLKVLKFSGSDPLYMVVNHLQVGGLQVYSHPDADDGSSSHVDSDREGTPVCKKYFKLLSSRPSNPHQLLLLC